MLCVIRVDSSIKIGSGHVMRCITLAKKLQKNAGYDVHFICRELEGNIIDVIAQNGFKVHRLPISNKKDDRLTGYAEWLTVSQDEDAEDTIAIIIDIFEKEINYKKVARLVIDSYAIDEQWENLLRPYTKEIFVIDDLANRKHNCDYLLDQNSYLNREHRYDGLVPKGCQLYLGHKYALLRDEFEEVKKSMRKRDGHIRNIFVFYGGSDLTNETMKALQAMEMLGDRMNNIFINVIVGGSNPHKDDIRSFCEKYHNMRYYCQVNNIAQFMADADLALGAGGSTTWERLYLELPTIVTCIADNQRQLSEDCAKQGFIHYLGEYSAVTSDLVATYILKFVNGDFRCPKI